MTYIGKFYTLQNYKKLYFLSKHTYIHNVKYENHKYHVCSCCNDDFSVVMEKCKMDKSDFWSAIYNFIIVVYSVYVFVYCWFIHLYFIGFAIIIVTDHVDKTPSRFLMIYTSFSSGHETFLISFVEKSGKIYEKS